MASFVLKACLLLPSISEHVQHSSLRFLFFQLYFFDCPGYTNDVQSQQPVIRLYAVPLTAFTVEEDEEDVGLDNEEPESS
jgi:hypothetical protein